MADMERTDRLYAHCATCLSGRLAVWVTADVLHVHCEDCDQEVAAFGLSLPPPQSTHVENDPERFEDAAERIWRDDMPERAR